MGNAKISVEIFLNWNRLKKFLNLVWIFIAGVVEMADTPCSGRGARKSMRVQIPPPAQSMERCLSG